MSVFYGCLGLCHHRDHRCIVRPIHRNSQRRRARRSRRIFDGVGKGICQCGAIGVQRLHGGVVVVHHVAVVAVSANRQGAVGALHAHACGAACAYIGGHTICGLDVLHRFGVASVHVGVIAQHIASWVNAGYTIGRATCFFGNCRVHHGHWRIVGTIH